MPAYKDQKKGTWYAKFAYKDHTGKTRWTTKRGFRTKREATDYEADFKLRLSGDMTMKFKDLVEVYLQYINLRIRESTQAEKDFIFKTKILPRFGEKRVIDITVTDIIKWQNELLTAINPRSGTPYSQTYIKTVYDQMRSIMNFATRFYNLKDNPVKKAGSIGSNNSNEMKFWTLDEYKSFANSIANEPIAYYCFEVLFWTGIREGELLALTYDDFDMSNKTISISKTYQVINGKEVIGPPKTEKGRRTIQMPDSLAAELSQYFEKCYDLHSGRVFPLTKSYLYRVMKKGCSLSGVKQIRIHDLRHSHISLLISLGFSPVDIGNRVGHESITITLRYAHMFPSAQTAMANALQKIM